LLDERCINNLQRKELKGKFGLSFKSNKEQMLELFALLVVSKLSVYGISLGLLYLSGIQPCLDMYSNWDAGFFIGIAEKGYYSPASFAMFPLFPLFIRGFAFLFVQNYQVAGIFTANLFSFLEIIPAIMLFSYYNDDPSEKAAMWLLFPLYFVWGLVPYTEHVYSFFALTSWWCIKANHKALVIPLAVCASLIRQPGVLLFIPVALYFAISERGILAKIRYVLASTLIPISVLLWNFLAGSISGDPSAVVNAQQYFGSGFVTDIITGSDLKALIENYSTYTFPNHVAMPFLVVFITLACFLLVPKIYKIDKYLALYTVLNIGLFLCFLPLTSTLRYLSALFPLFLAFNIRFNMKLYLPICILSSSLMLYAFMATVFIG
jgi:hypothetical protein